MLNFIFSAILIIGGVILSVSSKHKRYSVREILEGVSIPCILVGVIWLSVSLIFHGIMMCTSDYEILENQIEYESLLTRINTIDSNYEDVSIDGLIKDVTEWNTYVISERRYNESLFLNWFNNDELVNSLETIDVSLILEKR